MTMNEFIHKHRQELDRAIRRAVPEARLNTDEMTWYILNDEGLTLWTKSEGVDHDTT